ncbi:hypothetical protein DUT91_21130 [Phyllobacterium salinisoli]|uniref:Uncharacterized protein n=1 Tax=Phyllobacterium salinisoli TaxID=1899321 RepID=A0A368JYD3_9HYPH|nr:hypothetical protein DUT91_21130 [Phyllobacterium salinisoli]
MLDCPRSRCQEADRECLNDWQRRGVSSNRSIATAIALGHPQVKFDKSSW